MDSSFPKYLIINLNTIFDFSSISFALLKKLEEDKTKDYNFGDVNLASFHIKSFKDFAEKYSNGDNKKKEELFNFIKNSELYTNVKPKLYILAQLHFLILNKLIDSQNVFLYYEEDEFLNFIYHNNYFDDFCKLMGFSKTNLISLNKALEMVKVQKVINLGEMKFMDDEFVKNENVFIVENAKKKQEGESVQVTRQFYFDSFDKFLEAFHPNFVEKYKTFLSDEFIMKYSHEQITKKFHFLELWNNYTVFDKQILIEGKVVNGVKRGSKLLGIPTANIEMNEINTKIITNHINGVYFGTITFKTNLKNNPQIDKMKTYKGVLSIGYNPFFNNKVKTIEVFLIDYKGKDFYEDEVSLLIDGYSRSEENFANLSELVTTITYDIILFNDILEKMKK